MLGPEHPLTVKSLRRLGEAHEDLSQYAEAQRCLEESVRIRLKILGDAHPDTASSLSTLGHLKERQHDYAKAEEYYRQALEILGKLHQDENAETGDNWFKIARFYYRNPSHQGKSNYELAAMACRHSVEIREAVLGPDHRRTADSLHILGLCESALGHPTKAKELIARALSIYKAQSEDLTELIATTTTELANAERVLGDAAHAEVHYREVLDNRRKLVGEHDAKTAAAYSNLGSFYSVRGLYEKAEPLLQQAIDIDVKISGDDKIRTAIAMAELARLYVRLGDEAKAESLYQKALVIEKRVRPRGIQTARLMEQIASLYAGRRDLRRAEPCASTRSPSSDAPFPRRVSSCTRRSTGWRRFTLRKSNLPRPANSWTACWRANRKRSARRIPISRDCFTARDNLRTQWAIMRERSSSIQANWRSANRFGRGTTRRRHAACTTSASNSTMRGTTPRRSRNFESAGNGPAAAYAALRHPGRAAATRARATPTPNS